MVVVRHDDFDFRMDVKDHIDIHQLFVDAQVNETAVLQFAQWGRLGNVREELVHYILDTPYWDIQLHGWQHDHYDEMKYDFIVRDLAAAIHMCQKYFKVTPTVWYPPWNCLSSEMEMAATALGLRIDNESYDISKFIREVGVEVARGGVWQGHSFYFHGWKLDERVQLPEALKLVKELQK